jgi:hypothetical protein
MELAGVCDFLLHIMRFAHSKRAMRERKSLITKELILCTL